MASAASIDRPGQNSGDVRPAGSVVAGRYRIDAPLGSGGMATVYRATDLATGKQVALKLLRREFSTIPEAASRFRREGELLQSFTHPGIVRVETFGAIEDGTLFLAMELLEGESLGQLMRRRGALDPREVGPILTGACAPLAAAHAKGIVHRDLKPDNVFLVRAPGAAELDVQVKLLDFGISKVFGSERLTQTGELLGTPRYMAPEQLAADHDLDGRVDVYALGVILYEMLAACPPFLGATPSDLIVAILHGKVAPLRSVRSGLPPEIESVVMRTIARAREARYATPEELANAFVSALGRPSAPGPMRERAPVRQGMETAVLGSMQVAPLAHRAPVAKEHAALPTLHNAPALPGQVATPAPKGAHEPLVPGTLSGFAASVAAAPPVVVAAQPSGAGLGARQPQPRELAATPAPYAPQGPHDSGERPQAAWSPPGAGTTGPRDAIADAGTTGRRDAMSGAGTTGRRDAVSGAGTTGRREAISDDPIELPTRGRGRTGLVIIALLAGAISMGIAIFVLSWLGRRAAASQSHSSAAAPPSASSDGAPGLAPGTLAPAGSAAAQPASPLLGAPQPPPAPVVPPEPAQLPSPEVPAPAVEPPAGTSPPPASEPVERGGHRRRRPSAAPSTPPSPAAAAAAPGGAAPQTPSELMMAARAAYARGEPEVCTGFVERALAAGAPAIALKLQGDCFRRSGRSAEALRSYQRFCRLVPDNPAMSEVQALAEGLGGSCP